MKTPILDDFCKAWIGLFSRSPKTRLLWKNQTGLPAPSYSATRWWSRFKVIHQLLTAFGDVEKFLANAPATSIKLLHFLTDLPKARKLKMEIAATVDSMELFVRATYKLEGDGPLSLIAYQQLSMLYTSVPTQHYPNVVAVAKLISYAKACVVPAYDYFRSKFDNDLKPVLDTFKAARLFSPSKFYELRASAADVDASRAFPFLDSPPTIGGLKSEIPTYMAASEEVSTDTDAIIWWKSHANKLPKWAEVFRLVLLVQSSSAAAERVFSILQRFNDQQQSSLEDYIELSIMLQYNHPCTH